VKPQPLVDVWKSPFVDIGERTHVSQLPYLLDHQLPLYTGNGQEYHW